MTNLCDIENLTTVQHELFAAACDSRRCDLAEIISPDWESRKAFHWADYVEESVCQLWDRLPLEAKLVAYIAAVDDSEVAYRDEQMCQEHDLMF